MTSPARPFITAAMLAVLLVVIPSGEAQAQKRSKASARKVSQSSTAVYSCPMHPEVKAGKAGRCPKCGMTLRRTNDTPDTTTPVKGIPIGGAPIPSAGAGINIPDVELLDQDGRKIHFYSDLVKGRVVSSTSSSPPVPPFVLRSARPSLASRRISASAPAAT